MKNGTVYMILAIGEEAVDEARLPIIMSRVAGILRLGKYGKGSSYFPSLRMPATLLMMMGNLASSTASSPIARIIYTVPFFNLYSSTSRSGEPV